MEQQLAWAAGRVGDEDDAFRPGRHGRLLR
jgi:hypothetical protein